MKKTVVTVIGIALGAVLIAAVVVFVVMNTDEGEIAPAVSNQSSPEDISVEVSGRTFELVDGEASIQTVSNSDTRETLRVFGDPVYGDLDNDGDEDAVLLLQYSGGGTGVFYYVTFALRDGEDYRASSALLLGDRISSQSVEIQNGRALVRFKDRDPSEPMSSPAAIDRAVWIQYEASQNALSEWVWGVGVDAPVTERYQGQIDSMTVLFEHRAYTEYRLITNGVAREGELNTERGFGDDVNATVYVLNWRAPAAEQMRYVRFSDEPTKAYLLDSDNEVVVSSVLTLE